MLYKLLNKIVDIEEPLFSIIACFVLKSAGVSLGKDVKCYGLPLISIHRGSQVKIGDNATLRSKSRNNSIGINHRIVLTTQTPSASIQIGKHVGMSGGAICSRKSVIIGDYSLIGANCVISDNDIHPIIPENRRYNRNNDDIKTKSVLIERNVWLGADVFICKGVTIGENTVIGAKSIVTKSIPPNCVAAGSPARVLNKIVPPKS